jgi:hypothetical protein
MMTMNWRSSVLLGRLALIMALAAVVLTAAASAPADVTRSSFVASFASSAPSFVRVTSYATGQVPVSLAIGDLNGDRKPDLATANAAGDTVSVLANRGAGRFRPKVDYRSGPLPVSVAIGDVNGDGKQDLVTANNGPEENEGRTVSVLANRGDGRFRPKRDYETSRGPSSVAIGDLNGDGKSDIVTTSSIGRSTVSVLLNNGDGTFRAKRDYATGVGPLEVAIGDLNGDGRPDLVTANYSGTVSVLLSRRDRSFQAKRDYAAGPGIRSVAIGNLNGDDKPDVATANFPTATSGTVSVLLNRGAGSFRAKRDYRTGREPSSVAIGDLNGDRKPDLATAGYTNAVSVLNNRGDGMFDAKLDYATGRDPTSVAIGDVNGDRKPDVTTAHRSARAVFILLNTPGRCAVQDVKRQTLPAAKRTIARANCRLGTVRRAYSTTVKRGLVVSQTPRFGTVLPRGGKINLVVSRGRK